MSTGHHHTKAQAPRKDNPQPFLMFNQRITPFGLFLPTNGARGALKRGCKSYRWRSSRANTSTVGPSIPRPAFPRRPQACPTKGVPRDGAFLADPHTVPRERWLLVPDALSLPNHPAGVPITFTNQQIILTRHLQPATSIHAGAWGLFGVVRLLCMRLPVVWHNLGLLANPRKGA